MKSVPSRFRAALRAALVTTTLAVALSPGVAGAAPLGKVAADDAPPTIVNQPVATSATLLLSARFAVKATGENLTYQWQRRIGSTWFVIDKPSMPSMWLKRVEIPDDNVAFRVRVSNSAGTVVSRPALLDVTPATSTTTIRVNRESQVYDAPVAERAVVSIVVKAINGTQPRGTLTLSADGSNIGSATLGTASTGGRASLRVKAKLPRGVHQLSVRFSPRTYQEIEWIDGSTSNTITFEVL